MSWTNKIYLFKTFYESFFSRILPLLLIFYSPLLLNDSTKIVHSKGKGKLLAKCLQQTDSHCWDILASRIKMMRKTSLNFEIRSPRSNNWICSINTTLETQNSLWTWKNRSLAAKALCNAFTFFTLFMRTKFLLFFRLKVSNIHPS